HDVSTMIAGESGCFDSRLVCPKQWANPSPVTKRLIDAVSVLGLIEDRRHACQVMLEGIGAEQCFSTAQSIDHQRRTIILIYPDDLARGNFQNRAPRLNGLVRHGVVKDIPGLQVAER